MICSLTGHVLDANQLLPSISFETVDLPWRRAHSRPILKRLVNHETNAYEHKAGKRSTQSIHTHQRSNDSGDCALPVVHHHVEPEPLTVRARCQAEQSFQCMAWYVGAGSSSEELFDFLGCCHASSSQICRVS